MKNIYIDVYFLMNLAIDFLSLYSTEKICFLPESKLRCFAGALVGALYSTANFFENFSFVVHLIVAFIMVAIIVTKRKLSSISAGVAVFLASEIFIGGCVNALKNISGKLTEKSIVFAASIILLSLLGSIAYTIVRLIMKKRLSAISLNAKLWHRGRCSKIILMVDSGNLVRDIQTKRRVIFVKAESVKDSIGDAETLFERERCYVIPIETTSGRSNVLGFIPDKIEFSDKKYHEEEFIVVPDMHGGKFGGYDGIAPFV